MQLITRLESWPKSAAISVGAVLLVATGFLDYVTGYDLSFSAFYLLPIFLLAWLGGPWPGWAGVVACTIARTLADVLTGHPYHSLLLPFWNAGMRFGLYAVVALILLAFRGHVDRQRELARTDGLTGLVNLRAFQEAARAEAERSRRYRHSLSVAYLDLDNFKGLNDSHGHAAGDEMLRTVAEIIQSAVRSTDIAARVGGDEFAVLFPETDKAAVRAALAKIQSRFDVEVNRRRWPVGLSVGVETAAVGSAQDVQAMIAAADARMYLEKEKHKAAARTAASRSASPSTAARR